MEMGYLFDNLAFYSDISGVYVVVESNGGYFPVDMDRRKVCGGWLIPGPWSITPKLEAPRDFMRRRGDET